MMDEMQAGQPAAAPVGMDSAPQDNAGTDGEFTVCIRCTNDKQFHVYVENAANEAAEAGGEGGDEEAGEQEPGGQPCKSVKECLTLALEIIRNNGQMPKSADSDFQQGFSQAGGSQGGGL